MGKRRKAILYAVTGVAGLILVVFLLRFIKNSRVRAEIPLISNTHTLSKPLQDQISEAVEGCRRRPSAENLGLLGMTYHSSANYEQAARCYELAGKRSRSAWIWDYYHGYLSMEMGDSEAVIRDFKRVLEKNPAMDIAWYYMGEAFSNLRNNEEAEKAFETLAISQNKRSAQTGTTRVDHFPLSTYSNYQIARIYIETGRIGPAEELLQKVVRSNPTFGPAYRLLGNVYSLKADITGSKWFGLRANDLVAFSPPVDTLVDRLVLLSRSELYLLKKIDEAQRSIYDQWALRLVNHALQYLPENKYVISKAISIYVWMNLDQQATALIDRHMDYFKENSSEMGKMGVLFFLNGLFAQSVTYLNRALELKPDDLESQKKLAFCYASLGEKQKAMSILDEMLERNRNNTEVLAGVAELLFFNLGETEEASVYIERLKQLAPANPKLLKIKASIAESNGRIEEAIPLYQASIRGNPEDLTTIKFLGNLLTSQSLWDRSINHYREALDYHPNDPYFLERLGTLLVGCPDPALRNTEEGRDYLERAYHHMYSKPATLVTSGRGLAYAYMRLGDKTNALATIRQTINIGRQEDISPSLLEELETLHDEISAY